MGVDILRRLFFLIIGSFSPRETDTFDHTHFYFAVCHLQIDGDGMDLFAIPAQVFDFVDTCMGQTRTKAGTVCAPVFPIPNTETALFEFDGSLRLNFHDSAFIHVNKPNNIILQPKRIQKLFNVKNRVYFRLF
jgi:hypothetical protein